MLWIVIVAVAVLLVLAFLFIVGTVSSISAVDDLYRDFDDREREAYLRRWNEEKKQKQEAKEARRKRR